MPPACFDPRKPADSATLSALDETLAQWPQVDQLSDDAGALKAMMRQLIDAARKQSDAACKPIVLLVRCRAMTTTRLPSV
ncbi:MAG: hypothetical protein R3E68_19695 [Burkholderiaceae bacterium]